MLQVWFALGLRKTAIYIRCEGLCPTMSVARALLMLTAFAAFCCSCRAQERITQAEASLETGTWFECYLCCRPWRVWPCKCNSSAPAQHNCVQKLCSALHGT
jgi:hypothetical protein